MKTGLTPHRLMLAAALALPACGVFAGELHALSESEMGAVYGRGLNAPALDALGILTAQEQSGSGLSATDALAALGALSADRTQGLDRQLTLQRLQVNADGVQATVKLAQSLSTMDKALLPVASAVTLPFLLVPIFGLPSPATLEALQHKH